MSSEETTNDRRVSGGREPSPDERATHEEQFEEGVEAAPPGVRAMAAVRWLILALMVLAASSSVWVYAAPLVGHEHSGEEDGPTYYCPMHPQITSDRAGECPICHMTLELVPIGRRGKCDTEQPGAARSSTSAAACLPGAP